MVAYAKPQKGRKKKAKGLRVERDQIRFINLIFEIWQVVTFRKGRRRRDVPYVACSRDE